MDAKEKKLGLLEAQNKAQVEAQKKELAAMKKKLEDMCVKKLAQQEEKIRREYRREEFRRVIGIADRKSTNYGGKF